MRPGQAGPLHGIDTEQVWTVLDGGAAVELDGQALTVGPGDTLILPADAPRRVNADPAGRFSASAVAPWQPGLQPRRDQAAAGGAVPDGNKLVPAWVV